jgi:predicted O-linked N-acetylglucosamine transferase (SPINDLY family)
MSDAAVAELIRSRGIELAVDLAGHTAPGRPGIFARRPAPIQIGYLGYPGTIGAPLLDYLVADRTVIPPEALPHYDERVVWLPGCFFPSDTTLPVTGPSSTREAEGLPADAIVFSAQHNPTKIAPDVFAAWMRVLAANPRAVLWLSSWNVCAEQHLCAAAEAAGIATTRLVFARRVSRDAHLARQQLADLLLDTFPYGAHSSARDALWGGLPVLTCAGRSFASRVGASLLHALNVPELIVPSLAAYEERACSLAADRAELARLKALVRQQSREAALFDTDRLRQSVETAYSAMIALHRRGEPPRHIDLSGGTTAVI